MCFSCDLRQTPSYALGFTVWPHLRCSQKNILVNSKFHCKRKQQLWRSPYANPPNSQGTTSKRMDKTLFVLKNSETHAMRIRLTVKAHRHNVQVLDINCGTHSVPIRLTVKAQSQNLRLRKNNLWHALYAIPPNSQGTTSNSRICFFRVQTCLLARASSFRRKKWWHAPLCQSA